MGGGADGLVVGRRHRGDLCAFVADGLHRGGVDAVGDEDPRPVAEEPGEPGHGRPWLPSVAVTIVSGPRAGS